MSNHAQITHALSLALEALEKERQRGGRDFSMLTVRAIETIKDVLRDDGLTVPQQEAAPAVASAAQPDAPASDWPDASPAGLRKMAEIAAPNNGAVFRAAADEIERLSAQMTELEVGLRDLLYAYHVRGSCQEGSSHITRCRCISCAGKRADAALTSTKEKK